MNDAESAVLGGLIAGIARQAGCGIIVIDHDLRFIMNLCSRIVVLDMGAVIADGPVEAVRHDPKVLEIYLGAPA